MTVLAVMYPHGPDTHFDFDYYTKTHLPLVDRTLAPSSATIVRGVPGPDGASPVYTLVALLTFPSLAAFQDAAGKHGPAVFADIPNFTNIQPVLQFNEAV